MRQSKKRRGQAMLSGALQQVAENVPALHRRTRFEVTEHGGRKRGTGPGDHAGSVVQIAGSGRMAFRGCDGGALGEQGLRERQASSGYDVSERGAHQAGDAGVGSDGDPLDPHLLHDPGTEFSVEVGAG